MSWKILGVPNTVPQITYQNRGDVIGNCGITTITDVQRYRNSTPVTPDEAGCLYRALAVELNTYTNYLLSDNILKVGEAYPEPRVTMDMDRISTGGFVAWLITNRYGRIDSSSRMCNVNHASNQATSIIQLWVWTPPEMQRLEENVIGTGRINRSWLRSRERIFKKPKELCNPKKIVSTEW